MNRVKFVKGFLTRSGVFWQDPTQLNNRSFVINKFTTDQKPDTFFFFSIGFGYFSRSDSGFFSIGFGDFSRSGSFFFYLGRVRLFFRSDSGFSRSYTVFYLDRIRGFLNRSRFFPRSDSGFFFLDRVRVFLVGFVFFSIEFVFSRYDLVFS